MADQCEFCANFVSDDEFGDYCNINLDEDEMARFLTRAQTPVITFNFMMSTK